MIQYTIKIHLLYRNGKDQFVAESLMNLNQIFTDLAGKNDSQFWDKKMKNSGHNVLLPENWAKAL